jgi:hypothetical protein
MKNDAKTNAKNDAARLAEILKQTARFTSRELAFGYAHRAERPLWVMLGDDGRFWVTTPANCARLEKMGYDWAE